MPAIIPAIAGFAAAGAWGTAVGTFIGLGTGALASVVGGAIVGAVAGAVVGGISAAVMGGDIMDGVLYGAVGGAVGGALGGAFSAGEFAAVGDGVSYSKLGGVEAGTGNVAILPGEATMTGLYGAGGAAEGGMGLAMGLSGDAQGALVQGGMGLLQGFGDDGPEVLSQAEQDKIRATDQQYKLEQIEASKQGFAPNKTVEVANINAAQSDKESLLNAELTREKYKSDESSLAAQLAQQRAEMNKPYEEAAAKRARILETAQGFAVKRKGSGGQASTAGTEGLIDDTPNYMVA